MKSWRLVSEYLSFTKKERLAILILVLIISLSAFYPTLQRHYTSNSTNNIRPDTLAIFALRELDKERYDKELPGDDGPPYAPARSTPLLSKPLFEFDPNLLDSMGWISLGLPERTIQTILRFRNKGGRFRTTDDLTKIYGLRQNDYERLAPFIKIENGNSLSYPAPDYPSKKLAETIIEVNGADSAAFVTLPGIGPRLAQRIISFRKKLGGFYSVEQLREVYGIADSTYQQFSSRLKIDITLVTKLNVNKATKEELKLHPYFKWEIANGIIEYRNQHGKFESMDDLKKVRTIDANALEKIRNYVEFQP